MKCKKCGYALRDNWNVCPKCSQPIIRKTQTANSDNIHIDAQIKSGDNKQIKNEGDEGKAYLIIFIVSLILGVLFKPIRIEAFVILLISVVTGYMNCPKNLMIKIIFWLTLIGVVLGILFILGILFMWPELGYSCQEV